MKPTFVKIIRLIAIIIGFLSIGFSIMYIAFPESTGNKNYSVPITQRIFEVSILLIYGLTMLFPYKCFKKGIKKTIFLIVLVISSIFIIGYTTETIISAIFVNKAPFDSGDALFGFIAVITALNLWAFFQITKKNTV